MALVPKDMRRLSILTGLTSGERSSCNLPSNIHLEKGDFHMPGLPESWFRERIDVSSTQMDNIERNAWIAAYLAHEVTWRWHTSLGITAYPSGPGEPGERLDLASPHCLVRPTYFATLEPADASWVPRDGESTLQHRPGVEVGSFRGFELPMELQSLTKSLGLEEYQVPGHERCFHRRSKDLMPLMWTIALLLRTNGGESWRGPRTWDVIAQGKLGGGQWTNGHSTSALQVAMNSGPDYEWTDQVSEEQSGRYIVVYNWGFEGWHPVALRNDGVAFTQGNRVIEVGRRWRAGERLTDLATEIAEVAASVRQPG